jgi:hypothetical protein
MFASHFVKGKTTRTIRGDKRLKNFVVPFFFAIPSSFAVVNFPLAGLAQHDEQVFVFKLCFGFEVYFGAVFVFEINACFCGVFDAVKFGGETKASRAFAAINALFIATILIEKGCYQFAEFFEPIYLGVGF